MTNHDKEGFMSVIDLTSDSEDQPKLENCLSFPNGAVRLTYNRFAPMDRSQYLTFDEILGPVHPL